MIYNKIISTGVPDLGHCDPLLGHLVLTTVLFSSSHEHICENWSNLLRSLKSEM